MSRKDLTPWAIFRIPVVVAVLSLIGLVGALLDDGAWDGIGSGLLAVAVVVTIWALVARRRRAT
ncbi:MAG: hypothetical protein EON91_10140 [Brevundimonas sp.]|uniref:hypothetical protein n=1 Tax=Brevundimonas sp. TaxID=1871086 RepID=UPI0012033FD7|nr:hypothetical protein [Brevundimonas sp.]RZJ17234.1 MAG: hypothetical protein EON91_10140 [Brevundimonas sp.]